MPATISAIVITRNEAETIRDCLESLAFCDEIVVVDSGSTDGTREIAASLGARVIENPFAGFGPQKEFARRQASCEWVLSLDADERIPPALAEEIVEAVASQEPPAYRIPRLSFFLGKPFRHSGWWPDLNLRLFRREAARFPDRLVHESAETDGPVGDLAEPMLHMTVRSLEQALDKAEHYSRLGARQLLRSGRRVRFADAPSHGLGALFKTLVVKRGILGGREGFLNAAIHARTVFWKYMLAWEEQRRR